MQNGILKLGNIQYSSWTTSFCKVKNYTERKQKLANKQPLETPTTQTEKDPVPEWVQDCPLISKQSQ